MPKKLKNLEISKVAFVDAGANQRANVKLAKRKDEVPGQDDEQKTKKMSLAKRLIELFNGAGVKDEDLEGAVAQVEKGEFTDNLLWSQGAKARDQCCDQIWDFTDALRWAIQSNIYNKDMTPDEREAAIITAVNEFSETVGNVVSAWKTGNPGEVQSSVSKMDEPVEDDGQLGVIEKHRDLLTEVIEKSACGEKTTKEEKAKKPSQQTKEEDMKIDKSKMTESERAFFDSIEKRYGVEDAPETGDQNGVQKHAPETHEEPKMQEDNTPTDDIYKGLNPEIKAELESLKKFKSDAEDKELHDIAKRYEILGRKGEELFPVLKSLKQTSQEAFDQFVAGLDSAKETVAKSDTFGEIGKSGDGTLPSANIAKSQAEGKVESIAKGYIEKDPSLTMAQARAKVWDDHPELYDEYENEM